jgi:hypothetical protein
MAAVMIGVDAHKGSHTAVAIDAAEVPLGTVRVRASAPQAARLVDWVAGWPDRPGRAAWATCWPSSFWRPAARSGYGRRWQCVGSSRHAGAGCPLLAAVDGEMLVVGGTGPVPSPFPAG